MAARSAQPRAGQSNESIVYCRSTPVKRAAGRWEREATDAIPCGGSWRLLGADALSCTWELTFFDASDPDLELDAAFLREHIARVGPWL